jgi:hypothetical protein
METEADFGDPEFEPSDEQLQALSSEAFAEVHVKNSEALERLRAEIAVLRARVLSGLSSPGSQR